MKRKTYGSFIEKYLENKGTKSPALDYSNFLKNKDYSAAGDYTRALIKAKNDLLRSRSEYGKRAESLHTEGLSNSGFADYLNRSIAHGMRKTSAELESGLLTGLREESEKYREYAEAEQQKEASGYTGAVNKIVSSGTLDYDTAYKTAIGLGLSEDRAAQAAKKGVEAAKDKLKKQILSRIIINNLTSQQTKLYAEQMGLDAQEANKLAEYAKLLNIYVGLPDLEPDENGSLMGSYQDYLKYLESLYGENTPPPKKEPPENQLK